jgi:hypothetical protein
MNFNSPYTAAYNSTFGIPNDAGNSTTVNANQFDSSQTVTAISIMMFFFAVLPILWAIYQKLCGEPESFASDGNTVAVEEDMKDVETGSVLPVDTSIRSVPQSDIDRSRKGGQNSNVA